MRKKGKIIIQESKKDNVYKIEFLGKKGNPFELFARNHNFDKSLNGKECEAEVDGNNNISNVWVDGKEIPEKKNSPDKLQNTSAKYEGANTMKNILQNSPNTSIPDSYVLSKTMLPSDTKKIPIKDIDNFYLKFCKAIRFEEDSKGGKFKFYQRDSREGNYEIKANFPDILKNLNDTYRKFLKKLYKELMSFAFETEGRMVIGLGGESVYEVSMTLHYIYGFPYIPASAIKGITRSWIITEKFNSNEKEAFKDQGFCDIFGCSKDSFYSKAHKGKLFFLDAFPQKKPEIEVDVMNPHYSPYYTEGKPPGDYYNPIPIFFLTVKNTPFEFHIGINKNEDIKSGMFIGKTYLEVAEEWIKKALSEHGIGAKTSVGYGTMQ